MGDRGVTEVIDDSVRERGDGGYRGQWENGVTEVIDDSRREKSDGGYRRPWTREE